MTADRKSFDPLAAGALLAGVMVVCIGLGALAGWALDAVTIGVAVGAIVAIPAAVAAVIARYRNL